MKKIQLKKMAAAITFSLMAAGNAHAANWLMLQGTEPGASAARAKVWGFIQPEYQATDGTKLAAGPWGGQNANFNMMRPDLKNNGAFNVIRARLGVRGVGMPLDSNVNYFLLAEFGNNGITRGDNGVAKVTDASVTLNHIKGAKVRAGMFKYPGSEEGLQAIHVFDYINFTNFTNQQLLERFFDGDGSDTQDANKPTTGVGAFRDVGVQVFDTFNGGNGWSHSYALMVGNGNGITRGDNDDNKDFYAYWASEKTFAGKGPRVESWKLFAWSQTGKRTLTKAGAGEYDRKRWGLGTTFKKGPYRAAFEYFGAEGMIFNGTDGGAVAGSINNPGTAVASWNMSPTGEADGFYIHGGYALNDKWELDVRYDELNRLTDKGPGERRFETTTIGAQYFFNKKSRFILNYEIRDAEAPNLPATHGANKILGSMDDRLSLQFLVIY